MTEATGAPGFVPVLEELDAGIFERKIAQALAETARSVVNADSKKQSGKITIELDLTRIGEGAQVQMTHKLTYARPTLRGKIQETDTTQTLLYVGRGGKLTITPDTQTEMFAKQPREVA